ncbi:MAG: hypothetical protein GOV01_01965 [Candidatus Altiarchaeota archaeon]|nr:hypothetical protein [Candidatus Altiarchaeota archaeon]
MKYLALLLLLVPVAAFTYTWDYWDERCVDDEFIDFRIYSENASFRTASGAVIVDVEPEVDVLDYVALYSNAEFAGFSRPMIPGFDFPSTIPLRISSNYTFYIPFGYSENIFKFTVVANTSEGEPRCLGKQWEINDTNRVQDENLTLSIKLEFNPETNKFEYNITNLEDMDVRVFVSVFSDATLFESTASLMSPTGIQGYKISKESKLEYQSFDVSSGIYEVYVVASTDGKSHLREFNLFEFYDFELTIPELPVFRPGETYQSTLVLKNIGYKTDSYDVGVGVYDGWGFTVDDPGTLDKGQDIEIDLSYTVPELHIGDASITLNLTSSQSNMTKYYSLDLTPEKLTTLEVSTRDISEIQAYSQNNVSVVVISSGTISPKIYYYVYTDPALLIRDGFGTMTAYIGEINKQTSIFEVGGSCAMSEQNSQAFNAGRKTLMFGNIVYYLTSELTEENMDTLLQIKDMVEAEKLKMTSDDAGKLFSNADKFSLLIERFVDGFEDERSTDYFRSLREDLYLYNVDLGGLLKEVGDRMSESCSSVDSVDFHVFAMDLETLQYRDIPKSIAVLGPKIIEFIGPSEIKAISGSSVFFDYVLKNNAGEGFEVDFEPSTDIILLPAFVYLPADSTKDIEMRIRPPEYFEAEDMSVDVSIQTRTYSLKFPMTLTVGPFNPELISDKEYAVSPGSEKYINLTFRTGGLDDTFRISADGPSWVKFPERFVSVDGEAILSVYVSAPTTSSGSEYVDISIYSESFPDYSISESFDIFVSSEANEILERLTEDERFLEERAELLDARAKLDAERYLRSARNDIAQNEFTSAKLNLGKAENIIFSASEEETNNTGLYLSIGVLIVAGLVFWKFILPKIIGTPDAPVEQQEVI